MGTIDISDLFRSLPDWRIWAFLAVVIFFGGFGGIAQVLSMDITEKKKKVKEGKPGLNIRSFWSYIRFAFVGSVAALAIMVLFVPDNDLVKLISIAIIAGFGGKAIMESMLAKIQASAAQAETVEVKEVAKSMAVEAEKATKAAVKSVEANKVLKEELKKEAGKPEKEMVAVLRDKADAIGLEKETREALVNPPDELMSEIDEIAANVKTLQKAL